MKILHVYKHALPDSIGGVEAVIAALASFQAQAGHEVIVLASMKRAASRTIEIDGYRIRFCKSIGSLGSTPFSGEFLLEFKSLVKNADIVNFHYPYPFADLCFLLFGRNKPSVVTYHSDILRQRFLRKIYAPLQTLFMNRVQKVIATSPNYLATSNLLNKIKSRVEIVPLGCEDMVNHPQKIVPNTPKDKFFLFVGEFRYYKALEILIAAASGVNAEILVAGSGKSHNRLVEMANQSLSDNVSFLGRVSNEEKFFLYENCYAVVFPSHMRAEAFGMTLIEASMFGKPMISCEIGTGTSFVNLHEQTGIVIPPGDPVALSNAMNEMLRSPNKTQSWGKTARSRYVDLFQADQMGTSYEKIYRKIIDRKR